MDNNWYWRWTVISRILDPTINNMEHKLVTLNAEEEAEFVSGLKEHDQQVFAKMYSKFSPALYGTILNCVKDTELAENLLQDVFMKAWNNNSQYDAARGRLFVWMYRISRNICIDHIRSKRHRISKLSVLSGDAIEWVKNRGEAAIVPDHIGLRKIVQRLRKDERELVELLYFKGYTQAEVASFKAIPIGTVKTRSSRAIKNLRKFFASSEAYTQCQLAMSN
jgi:RNA polymerase sigma factor (sigma-70 family)